MNCLFDISLSKNDFFLKDTFGNMLHISPSNPITQSINLRSLPQEVTVSVPWEEVKAADNESVIGGEPYMRGTAIEGFPSLKSSIIPSSVTVDGTVYPTASGARMVLASVKGRTRQFNQLAKEINSTNWTRNQNTTDVVWGDNECTFTPNAGNAYRGCNVDIVNGHKYLLTASVKASFDSVRLLIFETNVGYMPTSSSSVSHSGSGLYERLNLIVTADNQNACYIMIRNASTDSSTYAPISFKDCTLFDLTARYGAGNEPTTVEQVKADLAKDYYANNAGTLYNSVISGLKTYAIDSQTELGSIAFTAQSLGGVGAAQDELVVTKNAANDYYTMKKLTRTAQVDLGTLTWTYSTSVGNASFKSSIIGRGVGKYNIICSRYKTSSAGGYSQIGNNEVIGWTNSANISVRDDTYTDAATFKTAMSGVMLTYELATPIETVISSTLTLADVTAIRENGGLISVVGNTNEDYTQPDVDMGVVYDIEEVQ